jgi:hypothetical protein
VAVEWGLYLNPEDPFVDMGYAIMSFALMIEAGGVLCFFKLFLLFAVGAFKKARVSAAMTGLPPHMGRISSRRFYQPGALLMDGG